MFLMDFSPKAVKTCLIDRTKYLNGLNLRSETLGLIDIS